MENEFTESHGKEQVCISSKLKIYELCLIKYNRE